MNKIIYFKNFKEKEQDVKYNNVIPQIKKEIEKLKDNPNAIVPFKVNQKTIPKFGRMRSGDYRIITYKLNDILCIVDFINRQEVSQNDSKYQKIQNQENNIIEYIKNYKFEEKKQVININSYLNLLNYISSQKEDYTVYESKEFSNKIENFGNIELNDVFTILQKISNFVIADEKLDNIKKYNNEIFYIIESNYTIYFEIIEDGLFLNNITKNNPIEPINIPKDKLLNHSKKAYPLEIFLDGTNEEWREYIVKNEDGNIALSPEEKEILDEILTNSTNRFPFFINGRAGSGKSTILQYLFAEYIVEYIEHNQDNKYPPLYLTYNESLKLKAIEKVTNIILAKKYLKEKIKSSDKNVIEKKIESFFKSFDVENSDSFLIELLIENKKDNPFENKSKLSFSIIKNILKDILKTHNRQKVRELSPELVWYVIRTFIKGRASINKNNQIEYFSPENYKSLPTEQQTIKYETFNLIYEFVYPTYNKYLIENNFYDDLDLVIEIFKQKALNKKYSVIFCDEAQDFTKIEFDLILNINIFLDENIYPKNINYENIPIVFAGDPFQTINPTGFSFKHLQANVYESFQTKTHKKITPHYKELEYNYRSNGTIIKFSNNVQLTRTILFEANPSTNLKLQKNWFGDDERTIFYFNKTNKNLLKFLKDNNDKYTFLTPIDLKNEIYEGSALNINFLNEIFDYEKIGFDTPIKVKGREFDIVVVFGFGDFYNENLENIEKFLTNGFENKESQLSYEYFFNNLYVAITRARNKLYIIDSEESYNNFWLNFNKIELLLNRYSQLTKKQIEDSDKLLTHLIKGQDEDLILTQTTLLVKNRLNNYFERLLEAKTEIEYKDYLTEIKNIITKNTNLNEIYKLLYKGFKKEFEEKYIKSIKDILKAVEIAKDSHELSKSMIKSFIRRSFYNLYKNLFHEKACDIIKEFNHLFKELDQKTIVNFNILQYWCNKEDHKLIEYILDEEIPKDNTISKILEKILIKNKIDIYTIKELYKKQYIDTNTIIKIIKHFKELKEFEYILKLSEIDSIKKEHKQLYCEIKLELEPNYLDCLIHLQKYDKVIKIIQNLDEFPEEYSKNIISYIDKTNQNYDLIPFPILLKEYNDNYSKELGIYILNKLFNQEDISKYISDIVSLFRRIHNPELKEYLLKEFVDKFKSIQGSLKDNNLFKFLLTELNYENNYIDICSKIAVLEKVVDYDAKENLNNLLKFYRFLVKKNYYKPLLATRYIKLAKALQHKPISKIQKELSLNRIELTDYEINNLPFNLKYEICNQVKNCKSIKEVSDKIKQIVYEYKHTTTKNIEEPSTRIQEVSNNINENNNNNNNNTTTTDIHKNKQNIEENTTPPPIESNILQEEKQDIPNKKDNLSIENLEQKLEEIYEFIIQNKEIIKQKKHTRIFRSIMFLGNEINNQLEKIKEE